MSSPTLVTTPQTQKSPKQVKLARSAGFCYGVKMAVDKAFELAEKATGTVYVLGELIHNPQVIEKLKNKNVVTVSSVDEIPAGATCLVRTHGVGPEHIDFAINKGIQVEDATCPDVKRVQDAAIQLANEGYTVVIIGKADHPEIKGISSYTLRVDGANVVIGQTIDEIKEALNGLPKTRIGVVSQTTQKEDKFFEMVGDLAKIAQELKVFNTICPATYKRQNAAEDLADEVELMVVVGGKNSSNTTHLAEVAKQKNIPALHVETVEELKGKPELDAPIKIGVTAGASTPDWLIDEVVAYLESYHLS